MAEKLVDGVTIAASGSYTSQGIPLRGGRTIHAFSYKVTGDGTVQIVVETSLDKVDWISNGAKASDLVKTSGPGSDGKDIIPLTLKPGDFLRIIVYETGTSNEVVVTILFIQK